MTTSASSLAGLAPGDSRIVECGEAGVLFDVPGDLIACGGSILTWPSLERLASYRGIPLGWGSISGADYLLLDGTKGNFSVVAKSGDVTPINVSSAGGRSTAGWSPDRSAVWLETGGQTGIHHLVAWTPDVERPIASAADPKQMYTNIGASLSGAWVAVWGNGCAVSDPGGAICGFRGATGRADGSGLVNISADISGLSNGVVFAAGDAYYVVVQSGGSEVDVWTGRAGAAAAQILTRVQVWPLADGSLAVADADGLRRVDVATGAREPMALPAGIAPTKLISVSPRANWVVALSGSADESLRFAPLERGKESVEISRIGEQPSIQWAPDERFAILGEGPPFTTTVVRVFSVSGSPPSGPPPLLPGLVYDGV